MKHPCQINFDTLKYDYKCKIRTCFFLSLPFGGGLEGASKILTNEEFYNPLTQYTFSEERSS